jgi:acyl-CoA thioester hydrolase
MRFHETVHGVWFDDLDAFQILHNVRYLLIFERTIGGFWQHLGWGSPLDAIVDPNANPDQYHLVRTNHIEYIRPVRGVGNVRCRIWVDRLGQTSVTFGFAVLPLDEDEPFATGTRVLVRVDSETQQPVPWTDGFRVALSPYTKSPDAASRSDPR